MGQGYCNDVCDRCLMEGPVWYQDRDRLCEKCKDSPVDYKLWAEACSAREEANLIEHNNLLLDLGATIGLETTDSEELLDAVERLAEENDELTEQLVNRIQNEHLTNRDCFYWGASIGGFVGAVFHCLMEFIK